MIYDYEHVIDSYYVFKFKLFENNATELILKAKSIKFYFKTMCSKWNFDNQYKSCIITTLTTLYPPWPKKKILFIPILHYG